MKQKILFLLVYEQLLLTFKYLSPENMQKTFLLTRSNTGSPTTLFYAPMMNRIQKEISSGLETGRHFYTFEK